MRIFVVLAAALALASAGTVSTATKSPPKNTPSNAALTGSAAKGQKANVDANFGGLVGAKSPSGRSPADAHLRKQGNGRVEGDAKGGAKFNAQRDPGQPSVSTGLDGKGTGSGTLDKGKGVKGKTSAKGGKDSSVAWTKDANSQTNVNMAASGKTGEAHGTGAGGKDKFNFKDGRGDKYDIDPTAQSKTNGAGTINSDSTSNKGDGSYTYTIMQDGSQSQATLKDAQPAAGRSGLQWTCTGAKVGSQVCKDAQGKTVGRAQVDGEGRARVYDKSDRLIGRGDVEKKSATDYVVNLNKPETATKDQEGLYLSEIRNWKEYDCYKEIAKKDDPNPNDVKISKPFKFDYNSDKPGGYKFPDCFKMSGEITLGAGVNIQDCAMEFQVRVNPLGDFKCSDPGVCGRECYYCDACDKQSVRWKIANQNSADKNVCNATGGNKYTMEVTVCPPGSNDLPICAQFDRSFGSDYWRKTKEDTVITRVLVWKRPSAQTQIEYNFFYRDEKEGTSFRNQVQTQAQLKGLVGGKGVANTLTDFELLNAYVRQQLSLLDPTLKEELLSCQGSRADYNLAGSKVGGKFLVGAADTLSNKGGITDNVYSKPVCKNVAAVQADEFNRMKQAWVAAGKPQGKTSALSGGLTGLLGGGK